MIAVVVAVAAAVVVAVADLVVVRDRVRREVAKEVAIAALTALLPHGARAVVQQVSWQRSAHASGRPAMAKVKQGMAIEQANSRTSLEMSTAYFCRSHKPCHLDQNSGQQSHNSPRKQC